MPAKQSGAEAPKSADPVTPRPEGPGVAKVVQLTAPYAFYDDDGSMRSWNPGQKVAGSDAALLIERNAPVREVV